MEQKTLSLKNLKNLEQKYSNEIGNLFVENLFYEELLSTLEDRLPRNKDQYRKLIQENKEKIAVRQEELALLSDIMYDIREAMQVTEELTKPPEGPLSTFDEYQTVVEQAIKLGIPYVGIKKTALIDRVNQKLLQNTQTF